MPSRANLWWIHRAEADFADRMVFTIRPIVPSVGLPDLNFSPIHDPRLRSEVEQHWREFSEVFLRQLPNRTVNAAKDICENLLYDT